MKRTWVALLVIIASAIITRFLGSVIPSSLNWLNLLVHMVLMLVIGHFLSPSGKRNNRWLGKVIISLVVVFIVAYRLNWFTIPQFTQLISTVGLTGFYLDLLLVYCGWAFFQV